MLGKRETDVYGTESLSDLESKLNALNYDADLEFFQSNSEEEIINKILHKKKKSMILAYLILGLILIPIFQ